MTKIEHTVTEDVQLTDGRSMPLHKGKVDDCPDDKLVAELIKAGRAKKFVEPPAPPITKPPADTPPATKKDKA